MIEISVAVIALSFAVLVVYLILTLNSARASLEQTNQTLSKVQTQLDQVSKEALILINNTNLITSDVHDKMKSLDSLFESIEHVGESVQQVTSSVKQVSATVADSFTTNVKHAVDHNDKKLNEVVKWASVAMNLWHKWQGYKKSSKAKTVEIQSTKGDE